jgi:hypothetical protein
VKPVERTKVRVLLLMEAAEYKKKLMIMIFFSLLTLQLTIFSILPVGTQQLTRFRMKAKNSVEKRLRACKNRMFWKRTLFSIGAGMGRTQFLLSANDNCSTQGL